MAQAAALKERQALERKEAQLKAEREQLEIETALAVANAKIKVYQECEGHQSKVSMNKPVVTTLLQAESESGDGYGCMYGVPPTKPERKAMSTFPVKSSPSMPLGAIPKQRNAPQLRPEREQYDDHQQHDDSLQHDNSAREIYRLMQRQTDIAEMLAKNQELSRLPQRDVPVFSGEPLDFRSFMRAFNHAIDARADSSADKLYFLEQYTRGEPQDLVKSCHHMTAVRGYAEAVRLLHERYGDPLKIATALINKACKWPVIKSEDGKALSAFSVFLVSCRNAMEDVDYMEEMDNPTTMRAVVAKLPFKMRERWRVHAYDLQERRQRRAKFTDLVNFIDRQAKITSDPLFGDLDSATADKKDIKKPQQGKKERLEAKRGGSFATSAQQVDDEQGKSTKSTGDATYFNRAFTKPCVFCEKGHTLEECRKLREKPHKERVEFLKKNGFCFGCLVKGHLSKECKKKMTCEHCSMKHPSILHFAKQDKGAKEKTTEVATKEDDAASADTPQHKETSACTGAGDDCVLAIVPVRVKNKKSNKAVEVYAFMDPGSSATFCTETLAKRLNVQGRKTELVLSTINSKKRMESYILTDLEVSGLEENNFIELTKVFTQRSIPVSMKNVPQQKDADKWPYLTEVRLPCIDAEVELLIGTREHKLLEPWKVIHSQANGPYAVKTALGWILNGPLEEPTDITAGDNEQSSAAVNIISVETQNMEQLLLQQYNHDFPERNCDDKSEMSQEDHRFMDFVSGSARYVDGHYYINLPLKRASFQMPNNRSAAVQRALNLKTKLKRNPEFHAEYTSFMSDMVNAGYALKVPTRLLSRQDGRVWYLPHHGVFHPQKKKLRVVFDCAASYQGVSLNSELLQGPDLTNTLVGVLTRFRQEPIAMMADIEKMYHQVRVPEEDTDLLRFLWWPEGDLTQDIAEYKMVVHLFGATSSPSCATFALQRTAQENRSKSSPEAVDTVLKNFYVDDCLKSVSNETQAIALREDLTALCADGGFRLTKWTSNSRRLLASVPDNERANELRDLDLTHDALPVERVLGVLWCIESDSFKFRINLKDRPITRRGILSVTSSIYDPLGFLAPAILPAKMLMQQLCKERFAWDDEIPEQLAQKWTTWLQELQQLSDVSVSRCVRPVDFGPVAEARLHHFSDASENGYGTVSYLRLTSKDGRVHCAFMMGRARVAPTKQTTIPRMELTAAVVALNTDKMLRRELQMDLRDSTFWTDSTTVLKYINNETLRFKTFVANRLATIRETTKPHQWKYVNTSLNPSDCASRGLTPTKFMKSPSWFHGPAFLREPESQWPDRPNEVKVEEDDSEVRHVHLTHAIEDTDAVSKLINHYSSWYRLKRAVAWILRLKDTLLQRCRKRKRDLQKDPNGQTTTDNRNDSKSTPGLDILTAECLTRAEMEIIRFSQTQRFPEEISMLEKGSNVKKNSHLTKLDPVIKDGVLRVGGRLCASAMPEHVKHPVIIPKDSHVTTLILRDTHEKIGHCGRNYMLSRLRQKYWIPSANSMVRKFLSRCVVCRKVKGKTLGQKMANLPPDRLEPDKPPFTNVGVDYFGPFDVKQGRSTVKRYGVLFTCLTTRAVHIEVAHSLDTDSCVNAIRRFLCRRGQVAVMRSDNGTNFVAAEHELRESIQQLNQLKIQDALMQRGIQWVFNPPAGSHFGGVWERQIRSVRKVMRSVLKEQTVSDECLQTLLCEVEYILNDRPLTTTTDDPLDLEALTPNHLLLMKKQPVMPPGLFSKEDLYARRRWKQIQYLADLFWKRWVREYLPLLQERQRWTQIKKNLSTGDVVMIMDESAPRSSWLLGRVAQIIPDAKGLVRRVLVKTKTNTLERPVDKLCLICEMDS